MPDETDLTEETRWFYSTRANTAIANLRKKNVGAHYAASRQEALAMVLDMIPPGAVVSRGDSVTVDQVGVIPELKKRNQNKIIDAFQRDAEGHFLAETPERRRMQREAFFSDVFLVGTNAVTLDGKLINVDGFGNRVAAMIFGPKHVIIVAGANKIVRNVDEGLERIRHVAGPVNAKRHFLKHHQPNFADLPCVRTGTCIDCNHDWRICHYTVIIEGNWIQDKGHIDVVLVGEDLGI